tara:strand:+ start:106 stop:405 length:300 start_codon:yes stop_codon:yes gene_type:complete
MITMNTEVYDKLNEVSCKLVKLTMCQLNISERRIVDSIRDDIEKIRVQEMCQRLDAGVRRDQEAGREREERAEASEAGYQATLERIKDKIQKQKDAREE